jgi:hypothetical protein
MFKAIQFFNSRFVLLFTIVISILLHIFFINMPPKSMHLWRQSHTLAVTRNFFEEEMNPMHPRVDNRFDTDGITGSQFPSFEIVLAKIYQFTGEQYWVQRSYCLFLHVLGIWGIFLLGYKLTSNRLMANLSAWIYACSPMLFYYAITALPDDLALPASIFGLYFFLTWFEKWVLKEARASVEMILCLFFVTIAGLTKIQYLAVGFFIVAFVFMQRQKLKPFHWLAFVLFGAIVSSLSVSWYIYARWLIEKSGLTDFGLGFNPITDFSEGISILISNLTSSLPELILNYSSFLGIIAAGYFLYKRRDGNLILRISFFVWAGAFIVYHLIELGQMRHHDYYMMPYLPILVIASAYGSFQLINTRYRNIALVLIVIQPILAFARIVPSRFSDAETGANEIFYKPAALEKLVNVVPNDALCIVGPDNSRTIYFYFLHKKGFGFGEEGLFDYQIKSYVDKGAEYLITSDTEIAKSPQIVPFILSEVYNADHFFVYSLKKSSK